MSTESKIDHTAYADILLEWNRGSLPADFDASLSGLKLSMTEQGLLFPMSSELERYNQQDLEAARSILEISALRAIHKEDSAGFERSLSLLNNFYNDLGPVLEKSPLEPTLRSLSLLRLLSQNRIAEFHTLIETLPPDLLQAPDVLWVLNLQHALMEGAYSRVWHLCSDSATKPKRTSTRAKKAAAVSASSLPRPEFSFFVAPLLDTIRNEIAACDERSYASLPLKDAQALLFFTTQKETEAFAKGRNWTIDANKVIHFSTGGDVAVAGFTKELDKEATVSSMLLYAKELESIV